MSSTAQPGPTRIIRPADPGDAHRRRPVPARVPPRAQHRRPRHRPARTAGSGSRSATTCPTRPTAAYAGDIAEHAVAVLAREHLHRRRRRRLRPRHPGHPVRRPAPHYLPRAGIALHDMLRVDDGRHWSYLCADLACCPPEGTPLPGSEHPAAAAMASPGLGVAPSRADLGPRTIAPVPRPATPSPPPPAVLRPPQLTSAPPTALTAPGTAPGTATRAPSPPTAKAEPSPVSTGSPASPSP